MARAPIPVARISALAAVVAAAYVTMRAGGEPHWRSLAPGVEFTILHGGAWCRQGADGIAALRVDPTRARMRVMHYSLTDERRPLAIAEWQRRTGALAVFNAGQFYPDLSYMGLLVSGGRVISGEAHPAFKAALVAARKSGPHSIRVLDLDRQMLDPATSRWSEVAQSFMLLDSTGALRARRSDRVANRTLVAEDRRGRIVVIVTEGGYTLSDLAEWARHAPLAISHAMSMDGGREAGLCIRAGAFRYASFGRWDGGDTHAASGVALAPLPSVVLVEAP